MSATEKETPSRSNATPTRLGTITDSVGNVFDVVPVKDLFGPRTLKSHVAIDKFKAPGKPTESDPVIRDGVATFESESAFSLLFAKAPDAGQPGRVYFQAAASMDRPPVWRAEVPFQGHKAGTKLVYEIYDPASGAKIDPSVIIVDPAVAMPFVLAYRADR